MTKYIKDNFDTGFLSPYVNFALFCASFVLAIVGFIFGGLQ
jgi:hypothetical protein